MEHLPPVGWADVATKRDLDHLGQVLEARMGAQEARLEARPTNATAETRSGMRTLFLGLVALQVSGAGLALSVMQFA